MKNFAGTKKPPKHLDKLGDTRRCTGKYLDTFTAVDNDSGQCYFARVIENGDLTRTKRLVTAYNNAD